MLCHEFLVGKSYLTDVRSNIKVLGSKSPRKQSASFHPKAFCENKWVDM